MKRQERHASHEIKREGDLSKTTSTSLSAGLCISVQTLAPEREGIHLHLPCQVFIDKVRSKMNRDTDEPNDDVSLSHIVAKR